MPAKIVHVDQGSPAEKAGISAGWWLQKINGHPIRDVLDYKFYSYDSRLELTLSQEKDGEEKSLSIGKAEGEPLGLDFETYLMDKQRSCANKCVFCFIDQLPKGMRPSLYFKDDDARLSFLMGNYISMTNLSEADVQRIIAMHISPLNVSIHTTNPDLRSRMLGNPRGGESLEYLRRFAQAGLKIMGQIVVCPGWNDGDQLRRTLRDLTEMQFSSCSLVPVGITKYRQGLAKLRPVDAATAAEIIDIADEYGRENLRRFGTRRFFCADELYLRAGRPLPQAEYYEGYRQLENGVGLMRSLEDDFLAGLATVDVPAHFSPFTIATGTAAAPFLRGLVQRAMGDYPGLRGQVIAVENDFFGHTIDVAGLLTGQDISAQLRGRDLGDRVLIPIHMMRHGETVFLDDYTVERLSRELGVPVQVVDEDGFALVDAMFAAE